MSPTTGQLLQSGLVITALGMGLVFASLAVLWALLALLTRLFQDRVEPGLVDTPSAPGLEPAAVAITVERARVAAVVAGAVLANAMSLPPEVSLALPIEHGRVAPSWVTGNRARPAQLLQPSPVSRQSPERRIE